MIDTDEEQRKRLVSAIEQIVPLSDEIHQAFLSVSRRAFVPTYYRREGSVLDWTLVETADAAYTDEALVTKIDPVSKHPSSSSSQPSLMAMKLEALDLHPGQRVLEIGAGTGYNAALIASLVGTTGRVVSIDIDEDLVEKAMQHLIMAGVEGVQVVCGDGLLGHPDAAPYDRLLATGSFRSFPDAWLDQLVPGGKLVGNLIGNLASVFVCLTKNAQSADGVLCRLRATSNIWSSIMAHSHVCSFQTGQNMRGRCLKSMSLILMFQLSFSRLIFYFYFSVCFPG